MRVQSVNLNLIPTGVMPIVHLSQYDRDADGALLFNIFNGPAPFNLTGCTATINGTKPDGNVYTYPCAVHSNFLTSAVYDQMTTVQGTHEAEIRISDGDSVVGTLNFQMAIEKAGVSEIDVSHTDVPTLLENIQASVDEAEYWAEQAASAVTGVSSFNGRHGSVLPIAGDYDSEKILLTSALHIGGETQNDVQEALEAIVNDGGAGHTILNGLGQEMPQRKNLRFAGANLSDDAQNDTTNVTITGGSGGSTITVTTIETTLYGETVTITDGTSTFTGVFDNSGVCVIDGVTATGTLTVTSGAASRTLNVPYFGNYTVALSFWAATINVSTDPDVVSAIVKKDGVQIGTVNFTSGSGTYIAGSTGAYTFEVTVGGIVFSSPTVTVTEQTTYSTTIDIFSAILNISTSASSLYGKTITIKKGSTTIGTTAFSAQGSATYTVHETGTYTCECEGYSGSATVSAETTYSVTINAGLDLSAWITAGSTTGYPLNPSSYANFSALEADEAAVRQLMTVHASVDYLAQATAGDSLMQSVIGSDVCAKWINLSDYALDTLSANADIKSVMDTADKYGYGEWGIVDSTTTPPTWGAKGNVPIMTANNAPYGTAIESGHMSSSIAAQAFDGDDSTMWVGAANALPSYVGYTFVNPIMPKKTHIELNNSFVRTPTKFVIQGSNDGFNSDIDTISEEIITTTQPSASISWDVPLTANKYYTSLRMYITEVAFYTDHGAAVSTLQFYGRELKPLVPTMTSNTTPKGEVKSSTLFSDTYPAWKAFDGDDSSMCALAENTTDCYVEYDFAEDVKIQSYYLKPYITITGSTAQNKTANVAVQGYVGSEWVDLTAKTGISNSTTTATNTTPSEVRASVTRQATTNKARLLWTDKVNIQRDCIGTLQFFGSDYSEKEFASGSTMKYIYDHGVKPSGAITGGTDDGNNLTLSAVGTATVTIDKGTRTYMGGKAGLHASGTNRLKCGSGYSAFTASNMPDSNGFDISSISGSVAVGIEQTASGTFDCTEIWIE